MKWWHYLYLPEATAAEIGFTHEGSLFGVPAWLREAEGGEVLVACPKVVVLQLYFLLADATYETFSFLFDAELEVPFSLGRAIQGGEGV